MNISNARATFGLNAKAIPIKNGTSGSVQIGDNNETLNLTSATKIVSFEAVIVATASNLVIDISDLDNTGSTAWTAGTAQVETATAAGSITGSGNASVIVTAADMTGSPKTVSVAVLAGDTAATWAGKVRTALAADADVSALFTVSGTSTAIILTRKPTSTYAINGTSVNVFPANDSTLNISLSNGTSTGITTASTSANTTSGVATAGSYAPDLDGNDFEGEATGGLSGVFGLFIANATDSKVDAEITQASYLTNYPLGPGSKILIAGAGVNSSDVTISPPGGSDQSCHVIFTIAGS